MIAGDRRGLDAGQPRRALQQRSRERVLFGEVRPLPEVGGIPGAGQLVLRFEDARRSEPRVDALDVPQASDQQRRTADQQHRQRQLGDHERVLQAFPAAALRGAPEAAQRRLQIRASRLDHRKQAEPDRGQR